MDFLPTHPLILKNILGQTTGPASLIIRPAIKDDIDLILEMHNRVSSDSLYNRYQIERVPTRREIEQIVSLERDNGLVLVATIPGARSKIVGLAYYVTTKANTAETAFLVEDLYQGQGIGRRLMKALTVGAKLQNICFFEARVLHSNKPMIHLLHKHGRLVRNKLDYGAFEMRMDIC